MTTLNTVDPIIESLKETFALDDLSFNWNRSFSEITPDLEVDGKQFFGPGMVLKNVPNNFMNKTVFY